MKDDDTLLCTVYKGSREADMYIFVPQAAGEDNIPDELRRRMGVIREVMTLEITPSRKLARADATRVLHDIRANGYYLQLPPEISGPVLFDGD